MIEKLKPLINALREELQQYGEMLARLDEQQEKVMQRAADDVLQTVASVQAQGAVIERARRQREECQREVSRLCNLPAEASFAQLIPALPDDYRPLVQALIQENNELLFRVQQRARQNHLLLSRSLDLMQRFMSSLFPGSGTTVYNENGSLYGRKLPTHALYEAVG